MKKKLIILFLLAFIGIRANASDISIYPIPAVFFGKHIQSKSFLDVVKTQRENFKKEYLNSFKNFPNVSNEITEKNNSRVGVMAYHDTNLILSNRRTGCSFGGK